MEYETTTDYDDDYVTDAAQAIEEASEAYEQVVFLAAPKVPCHECGGSGSTPNGSLGSLCLTCMGKRWLPAPGANRAVAALDLPDVPGMRAQIRAAGDALREGRALPPIPTIDAVRESRAALEQEGMQLHGGQPVPALDAAPTPALGAPTDAQLDALEDGSEPDLTAHSNLGQGGIGAHTDAQLDDIEDAAGEGEP
jgi:hypothetical protein